GLSPPGANPPSSARTSRPRPSSLSSCSPPMEPFLPLGQLTAMNHKRRAIVVNHEDHLQQASASSRAPDEQLVLTNPSRVGPLGLPDHFLGFLRSHSMFGQVLDVPLVPAEVQETSRRQ